MRYVQYGSVVSLLIHTDWQIKRTKPLACKMISTNVKYDSPKSFESLTLSFSFEFPELYFIPLHNTVFWKCTYKLFSSSWICSMFSHLLNIHRAHSVSFPRIAMKKINTSASHMMGRAFDLSKIQMSITWNDSNFRYYENN